MKVGVFGAGAIGASLGVRLSAAGLPVAMVARPSLIRVADALRSEGLDGTPYLPGDDLQVDEDPEVLRDVDLCLVTVKSRHTVEAAQTLRNVLRPDCAVISLQNGLRNPERLREQLGESVAVAGGMVSYNVVRPEPGRFRQATKGPVLVGSLRGRAGAHLQTLAEACRSVGLPLAVREDITNVMAGKLLLNLNNGVCAVTGVTIAVSLRERAMRWCFAQLMREGLSTLRAAGLSPRSIVGLPPGVIARLLPLPDVIVLRVAKSLAAVDPAAKSSTLQDLEAGKPTEIDDLCGEIVRRGEQIGHPTPINSLVTQAVHALEADDSPVFWSPETLYNKVRAASS